jgi:hypothetical protein
MKIVIVIACVLLAGLGVWLLIIEPQTEATRQRKLAEDERQLNMTIDAQKARLDSELDAATARGMNLNGKMTDGQYANFLMCQSSPPELDKNKRECAKMLKNVRAQEEYAAKHPTW